MRTLSHPDPVVQEVLDIWTARLLRGGIALGDLSETLARISSWVDWGPAWAETAIRHEQLARAAEEEGRVISATESHLAAARCHHLAFFLSVDDLDFHRREMRAMLDAYERARPHLEPKVERITVPFERGGLVGLLSKPGGADYPPVVIVLPGLDSTKETRHGGIRSLLRRGLAALSLEGPGQGEVGLRLPIRPDYEVAVAAAIDALESRGDLDTDRIAVYGASLGGYYACRAAAFEPRVKATVENCGPYDWGECFPGLPVVTRRAFQHYSGARSEEEAQQRASELTLRDAAPRIRGPLLVVHGGQDPLIPTEQAQRIVDEARGDTTFLLVPEGGHGVNDFPYRVGPAIDDWLAGRLGGRLD